MRSSNEFITLTMAIGEVEVRFRNYLEHQAQGKKRQKNGFCNSLFTKYICHHRNIYRDLMRVCHYLLNQMIFIKQTSHIYHMDVASRYKGSYQLATKNSKEVVQAFQWIYENTPLTYPKTLIVDDGKEFGRDTTKLMEKHDVLIQRGDPSQHRLQGIVETFNRKLQIDCSVINIIKN